MKWLRTLALLSSVLCVWQLTEGRPPAIPPRHQFNRVQSRGGPSFIQTAKRMYAERNIQNKINHKENPPPREFSSINHRRRFKTNPKPQSNLRIQSPRASPLIANRRHIQTNTVSQNIPTFGDAIKNIMSGTLEGHINNDLKNLFPGTPVTTSPVPIVDIALDFGHPVTSSIDRTQSSNGPLDSNPTFDNNNPTIANSQSFNKQGITPSNIEDRTIILASPDYPDSDVQTFVLSDPSLPEQNFNSDFTENSPSLDAAPKTPVIDITDFVIPDSGFPQPDFPPDFPDYSDAIATSPEIPKLEIPDSGFPEPNFPSGFPDYSDLTATEAEIPKFDIPNSGFPEPDFPPGFPDYSEAIGSVLSSPSGQGFNDFIIPDSGFEEPNFPPDFPDYSSSVNNQNGDTKSVSNSPSGHGFNDFIIPDSGFPEPNYPPDFPDYSSSVNNQNGNINSESNNPPSQGFNGFIIPDSGFPEPNYPPDFPDYSSSIDTVNSNTKLTASSPDYNSNSPDYNSQFRNTQSQDYNAQSADYNAPSPDYNSPSSPDYPQASAPNPDYPSYDYNLDYPNKVAQGKTIRNQQDLFDLVKISLLNQLNNGGGGNAPKSIAATPVHQNIPVNNPGSGNPFEQIWAIGQGVVDSASGTGKDLFGVGSQVVGVAQDGLAQTVDSISRAVDDIAREILRSIQLIGGELQFIANDSLQVTLQNLQKTTEIAASVGGDFYRASLQVKDMFGKFIGSFIENVGRFVGTAINRTVDGALKQAVSTGQFIGDLKAELIRSIVDNGSAAQKLVQSSLDDTGQFVSGMGGVTTRFTSSATRSLTGIVLR